MKYIAIGRWVTRLLIASSLLLLPLQTWYLSHLQTGDVKQFLNEGPSNAQNYMLQLVNGIMHVGFLTEKGKSGTSVEDQQIGEQLAGMSGDIWSARLFGVEWLDILAWAELSVLSKEIWVPLAAGGLTVLLLTMLLGRVFCSWLCPAGFLFDLGDRLRSFVEKRGFKFRDIKFKHHHKYVLLVVGLFVSLLCGLPLLGYFYPPALMVRESHALVYGFLDNMWSDDWFGVRVVLSGASLFLFSIVVFEFFISRRFWCRYMCPGGALYALFGRFRLFRIQRVPANCTDCGSCNQACPMGLHPMTDKLGVDCDNCFECHRSCPEEALPIRIAVSDVKVSADV